MDAYVKHSTENQIATIEFFHPKSNSFPSNQLKKLKETIDELGKDANVKVIVLKSAGENVFCAGASFDELLSIQDSETSKAFFMGFANVVLAMRNCPKLIIGLIQGKVVGGGVGLVAACDYSIASSNALVRLSELSIGIGPFVIEPAIRRKVGLTSLSKMTLKPKEWKSAKWCKEKGLFDEVLDDNNPLNKMVTNFTNELSNYSLDAMKQLKTVLWEGTENWNEVMPARAKMSGELLLGEYAQNTLKKLKSK